MEGLFFWLVIGVALIQFALLVLAEGKMQALQMELQIERAFGDIARDEITRNRKNAIEQRRLNRLNGLESKGGGRDE